MPTKSESIQKQHLHTQKEHAEWLEKLHKWRAEHKRALSELSRLQASILEHDANIDEHLGHIHMHEQLIERHERKFAAQKTNGGSELDADIEDGHSSQENEHRKLRASLKRMDKAHSQTIGALTEAIGELEEIRSRLDDAQIQYQEVDDDERVHEASVESFPASDSPSFNPGTT